MYVFDIVAIGIILLSALFGYWYGFVRETMTLVSWLLAAVLSYIVAPAASGYVKFIPVIDSIVAGSCELAVVSSFVIVFAITLLLLSLGNLLLARAVQQPVINAFDSSGGFVFGAFRGLIIVSIVLLITDTVVPAGDLFDAITKSHSAGIFSGTKNFLANLIPDKPPAWLEHAYHNLMASCNIQEVGDLNTQEPPETAL
ncbi:MAG: CvpA family protein [Rhodobacteraceae bacterium]|nr:CvpA family protein [Paracoccaceae bacterium]